MRVRPPRTIMPPARCPSTPGGKIDRDCPQPTLQQRKDLSVWLACEVARQHAPAGVR